jgi:hypothetical protein
MSEQAEPVHPLRNGNAAAIRCLLMERAEGVQVAYHGERLGVRATRLLTAMAPVLAWIRDYQAIRLTEEVVGYAMHLRAIASLATRHVFLAQARGAGWVSEVPVREMPEALVYPHNAYFEDLQGYDPGRTFADQQGDEAKRQHGMMLFMVLPSWSKGGLPT